MTAFVSTVLVFGAIATALVWFRLGLVAGRAVHRRFTAFAWVARHQLVASRG